MTRRVRLYSPARGSRGGDGGALSTLRRRTRGKLLCCRVPPMPPGYKPIIPVETSPIGAHRTVVAALDGFPADMPGAPKSARATPRGARTGPDGRALGPARYRTRGPPGTGRPVRKTREVGPCLGEDRGEPRRSTGRVAEAPVGESLVSAGLIWFPDLVGELGAGGADVDGGATGPPVPASRPARQFRKKSVLGATLTSVRPRRIPYHGPGPIASRAGHAPDGRTHSMSKSARRRQRASQWAVRGSSCLLPPVWRPPGRHARSRSHRIAPSTQPSRRSRAARRALAPVPTGLYDRYAAAPKKN